MKMAKHHKYLKCRKARRRKTTREYKQIKEACYD